MTPTQEIAITGIGVICPIGIGKEAYWAGLCGGRSGVRRLAGYGDDSSPVVSFGGVVADFDPKQYVRPRKSLKVMSRDIQLAAAAADMAAGDGQLHDHPIAPDRLGVLFGADMMACELEDMRRLPRLPGGGPVRFRRWGPQAMAKFFPLWMLKYLPNMPACHIGIAQDARGPNNTATWARSPACRPWPRPCGRSSRGQADVMIVGGGSCRNQPTSWSRRNPTLVESQRRSGGCLPPLRRPPRRHGLSARVRRFSAGDPAHAAARGVKVQARILASAATFEPHGREQLLQGTPSAAPSTPRCGRRPFAAGRRTRQRPGAAPPTTTASKPRPFAPTLGDVPVTAPKSCFGNLGAGSGAVELVASVLALQNGLVPPTRNYQHPDPDCPVNVVHDQPLEVKQPTAVVLNHSPCGQAMAVVLG